MENTYSKASIQGEQYVGGLMGINGSKGTITSSYYDEETTGQSDTDKGLGKTTAEMKNKDTFEGWDFTTIWKVDANSYPELG